jgi:hypothetical protein
MLGGAADDFADPRSVRTSPAMDNRGTWLCTALTLTCLAGCVAPLTAPSAFTGERFLCDAEHLPEFDALMEECRQDRVTGKSCSGYVSLRATIDKQPVVVDAPAVTSTSHEFSYPEFGLSGREIFWAAFSPYFRVSINMNMIRDPSTGLLTESIRETSSTPDILNLEARGGNYFATLSSQGRSIQFQAADELRVAFSGRLSRGGSVEGCFDVFPIPI